MALDVNLYLVANLQIRVVTELGHGNNAVRLEADVDYNLAFVHSCNGTHHHLFVFYGVQGLVIRFYELFLALLTIRIAILIGVPVEVLNRLDVL